MNAQAKANAVPIVPKIKAHTGAVLMKNIAPNAIASIPPINI